MTGKGDHHFSSRNHVSFRYTLWDHKDDNAGTGNGYFPDPVARTPQRRLQQQEFNLTDTHIFSPSVIHELRIGYARNHFPYVPASVGTNPILQAGLPSSVP